MKKEKPYQVITSRNIYHVYMKGTVPNETEEVNIILASFDEGWLPFDSKEMAQATCDLLNSQASSIRNLLNENLELKKKCIELARKIKPFGGPDGSG